LCRRRCGGAFRRHDRDAPAGELAWRPFEPGAVLLQPRAPRAVLRPEREHHLVALELDLLRLGHDGAVKELLRLADLGEERLLEDGGIDGLEIPRAALDAGG